MLKNTKRQLFITTTKGICCSLLATGLLLQNSATTAFANSSSPNIVNTGILTSNISADELQTLNIRTTKLEAYTQAEDNNVIINEHETTLNINDTFQIQLTDKEGNKINNVDWFVKVRVPYDVLYKAEDYNLQNKACTVSNDGLVTANAEGTTEVWAKYNDALYRCVINVNNKMDTDLENKVVEIADKFRHLSDVDKVMAVHDYLVDNIEYADSHIVRRAYGALIERKAVCQGYAQAFQKILSNLNIEGHTVIGYNIPAEPEKPVLHEWNRVKLDGKWYYIDLTWDDTPWVTHRNYKHFLINTPMLGRDHQKWYSLVGGAEADGSEYLYYAYKKHGILANNREELENIVKSQINSTNLPNVDINVAVPSTIHDYEIMDTIRKITGRTVTIKEENNLRNTLGDYHHYCYQVGHISTQNTTNVNLTAVKPLNADGGTTTKLQLIFDKDIDGLNLDNIKINGVHKTSLEKTDTGTYELSFTDIMSRTDTELTIQINKRGYNIANNEKTVNISVVKEAKPEAVFEATELKEGILKNIEAGMKYSLGDGIWHDITSSEPINITTIYLSPIYLIRKSSVNGRLDSDTQLIYPKNAREPIGVKAVNSTGDKSNGKIIYVNRKMEYQKEGEQTWTSCEGNEVTGLASGKYNVRYKADGLKLASSEIPVTVNAVPGENSKDNKPSTKPEVSGDGSSNNSGNGSVGGNNNSGGSSGSSGGNNSAGSSNSSTVGGGFSGGGASFGGGFSGGGSSSGGGGGFAGGGSASSVNDKTDTTLNNEKTNNTKTDDIQTEKIENTPVKSETVEDIKPAISKNVASFSKSALDNIIKSGAKTFDFTSNKIKLSFETNVLKSLNRQADSDIQIKAVTVNNTKLSDKAKKLIGKHSVYDLSISGTNGTKITKLGKGKVTISIPYKLGKKEKADNVAVYFIDKKGNVKKISGSVYNSKTKTLTFTTKSLMRFAVGRKNK